MGNKWDWESRVEYWENVYGFKMTCMKEEVFREAHIQVVDSYSIISSSDVVKVSITPVAIRGHSLVPMLTCAN